MEFTSDLTRRINIALASMRQFDDYRIVRSYGSSKPGPLLPSFYFEADWHFCYDFETGRGFVYYLAGQGTAVKRNWRGQKVSYLKPHWLLLTEGDNVPVIAELEKVVAELEEIHTENRKKRLAKIEELAGTKVQPPSCR